MRGSFHGLRQLGIGVVFGIVLGIGVVFGIVLGIATALVISQLGADVLSQLGDMDKLWHDKKNPPHMVTHGGTFQDIASRFSKLGENLDKDEPGARFSLLQSDLDAIRVRLTAMEKMPLTAFEQQGVTALARQEKRLRTALYAYTFAVNEDLSPEYSAAMLNEIKQAISDVTEQARRYR